MDKNSKKNLFSTLIIYCFCSVLLILKPQGNQKNMNICNSLLINGLASYLLLDFGYSSYIFWVLEK